METTMGERVARVIAHHAYTPLADGSHENYLRVKAGQSAVSLHKAEEWGLAEDFMAGLITDSVDSMNPIAIPVVSQGLIADSAGSKGSVGRGLSAATPRATNMALHSIRRTLEQLTEPLPKDDTLLIVSTTKGNINLITDEHEEAVLLGTMAQAIADNLGLMKRPLVVSNACTSGVCAQVVAQRALLSGLCRYAIVCGVEAQSRFIVSGFQSFHALSPEHCRPFSQNRIGLNVGEAAATIIYKVSSAADIQPEDWTLQAGAIRNDANHISGPSRTGEGSYRALRAVMNNAAAEDLAFVSVHGTATPYNDEMESIAIDRAGLIEVPIGSLKGYYGHTMGAAGVLETIISMEAVDDHTILATLGYDDQLGVSHPVLVASTNRATAKRQFVKLISGFGGCNAAIRMQKGGAQ